MWKSLSESVDQWMLDEDLSLVLIHRDDAEDWLWAIWQECIDDDDDQTPSGEYDTIVDGPIDARTIAEARDEARTRCLSWLDERRKILRGDGVT
jgi:hypothetical protein